MKYRKTKLPMECANCRFHFCDVFQLFLFACFLAVNHFFATFFAFQFHLFDLFASHIFASGWGHGRSRCRRRLCRQQQRVVRPMNERFIRFFSCSKKQTILQSHTCTVPVRTLRLLAGFMDLCVSSGAWMLNIVPKEDGSKDQSTNQLACVHVAVTKTLLWPHKRCRRRRRL